MGSSLDMGSRLALLALAILAGSALQLAQPALWPAWIYLALGLLATLSAAVLRQRPMLLALTLLALVFATTGWRAAQRLDDRLAGALEGRDLILTGVVASLPNLVASGIRFEFEVEQAWLDGAAVVVPPRISLGWYRQLNAEGRAVGPQLEFRSGERWRLPVRLRRPHGQLNPHGFDLELWLLERGIGASGYVRTSKGVVSERLAEGVSHSVDRARQAVRERIEQRIPETRTAGVLAALVVGDQSAIARSDWELFRITGIAHLVSISGLHVTMFAWLAAAIVGTAWRRSSRLTQWLAAPHAARWGGLGLATAYAVLAGWGIPAQRTVWMLAAVVLLRSAGAHWPLHLVLLAIAALVALVDPWALLQPGFWLSFVAVALLVAAAPAVAARSADDPWLVRVRRAAASGVHTQAVATVGLAPLTLLFFQQISVVGFVANLLAIPLITLVVTPLALAGMLWPALWTAAAWGINALTFALEALARWPFAVWTAAAVPGWIAAAGLIGAVLLVLPLPLRLRLLGLPLLLPMLWPAPQWPPPGRFEAVAVDVGQGTAVLVRTQSHLLVYDTGPQYSVDSDAGDRLLLPLLRARGERRIPLLMLSHRDGDHVGGAQSLLTRFPVQAMSSSLAQGHPLRSLAPAHRPCIAGDSWTWDGVRFDVLHPRADALAHPPARANGLSCVLRVADAQGASILLTGDIEAAQESALVANDAAALRSTVLLVPHHGSKTSSSASFLDAVAPEQAVVQAGYRSRFGHPAPEVLARFNERGVPVHRSDHCGAWTWQGGAESRCERKAARRYWHHQE